MMQEKYGESYIHLTCGHYIHGTERVMYRDRGKRNRYWCEKCGTLRSRKPKPKREPLPDEPPF